ncbi:MAG: ABC transporter ATP-binding protein [Gemmatimonadetes bacterium]|nr:MAG: ABC transporter ATP-binding protein [Gemmatimonadota bacterium]
MSNTQSILTLRDVSYTIEGQLILSSIHCEIYPQEFITVIGPNGAGKSTLLKHLNRWIPHQTGTITLHQKSLRAYSPKAIAKEIAYVPQTYAGTLSFTVEEFVSMGRYAHLDPLRSVGKSDITAIYPILETTHLIPFRKRILKTLSGGERQRVFIAAALAQQAQLVLLDEPTSFLDPKHRIEIYQLLKTINETQKTTLIIVTHDLNFALQFSDRTMALKSGQILKFDKPDYLTADSALSAIFDAPFDIINSAQNTRSAIIPRYYVPETKN